MNTALLVFSGLVVIILGWLAVDGARTKRRLASFFREGTSADLEALVKNYLARVEKSEADIGKITRVLAAHAKFLASSVQKVGMVRFNPFADTGGDQSFSLALLDQTNSGLTITAMHSREGTRVYAKPISQGQSSYNLSDEEKRALDMALKSGSKEV